MIKAYLNQWKFWVVLAVIILVIAWFFTTSMSGGKRYFQQPSAHNPVPAPVHQPTVSYLPVPVEEIYDDTRDTHISSRDAIPKQVQHTRQEQVDLTPNIPIEAVSENSHPKSESKGEKICREVLETIYGVPFVRDRPEWLINPETGRRMELDGWNSSLKIAFEYNGEQHYKSDHHFNRSYDMFLKQVARDNAKVDICDSQGVYLITVPYNVPHDKIYNYIMYYLPETVSARNARINQLTQY